MHGRTGTRATQTAQGTRKLANTKPANALLVARSHRGPQHSWAPPAGRDGSSQPASQPYATIKRNALQAGTLTHWRQQQQQQPSSSSPQSTYSRPRAGSPNGFIAQRFLAHQSSLARSLARFLGGAQRDSRRGLRLCVPAPKSRRKCSGALRKLRRKPAASN